MDRQEITRTLVAIVLDRLEVSEDQVTEAATLVEDLGADSLDLAEIVMECEDQFDLKIPDDQERIKTVGDAVSYIEELIRKKESDG